MMTHYSLGLDFGTNSVRALIVDVDSGTELGTSVFDYPSGERGILLDPSDPDLARQNPEDYLVGLEGAVRGARAQASARDGFDPSRIVGVGVDTTGSTPIPVDMLGRPIAFDERFRRDLDAQVWLWKDHTAPAEARRITAPPARLRP